MQKHAVANLFSIFSDAAYFQEDITPRDRESIARVGNCIRALANEFIFINDTIISFAYEASLQYKLKDMNKKEIMHAIATEATTAVDNMKG